MLLPKTLRVALPMLSRSVLLLLLSGVLPPVPPQAYAADPTNPDSTRLIWVPAGTFTMGSPTNELGRGGYEDPQTRVSLTRGIFMRKNLVTQGEYLSVVGNNPSFFLGNANRPVEMVTWLDATNFCAKLTAQEQQSGRLPQGWTYRLPTESEWEYVCRAGTTTRFSFGDDPDYLLLASYAWFSGNSGSSTHPVGSKLPNPWGFYDMPGNVQEWCGDGWYGYPGGSVADPTGATGPFRLIRGGFWASPGSSCRSSARGTIAQDQRDRQTGFRCVLAPLGMFTLGLYPPTYLTCGDVSVPGHHGWSAVSVTRLVWDWGDGTSSDSWFPGLHHYETNGDYLLRVTAYASTGEKEEVSMSVTVTNANDTDCHHIDLLVFDPAYSECGDVCINGVVRTTVGSIAKLSWDWGDGTSSDSWFPAYHTYTSNGSHAVKVTASGTSGETKVVTTSANVTNIVPACENTFRVYPPAVLLRQGKTNEWLTVDVRSPDGRGIASVPGSPMFTSSAPDQVQVTGDGRVSGIGFGRAHIEVRVTGQPRTVVVPVMAGEVTLEPATLVLSTNPLTLGQITLKALNADGSAVALAGHQVSFRGGNQVASVNGQGLVTPLSPPVQFWDTPYIVGTIDGFDAPNACVVRVTGSSLGLTMQDFPAPRLTFRLAQQAGGVHYADLVSRFQVLQVFDALHRIMERLTGTAPAQGGRLFLVMDVGRKDDPTIACGLAANPIRLGGLVDSPGGCFSYRDGLGQDRIQWGVIGHEMGHDFLSQRSLSDFWTGLERGNAYLEGMATALQLASFQELQTESERYGISAATVESFVQTMNGTLVGHWTKLAAYEAQPNYAEKFDADLQDAMMLRLAVEYGPMFMFRFLSVFYPPGESWLSFQNEPQRLAFWVAACSAAAQDDLRERFQVRWGYPIDNAFYDRILPTARQRASQRQPLIYESRVVSNRLQLTTLAVPDTTYSVESSADLTTWQTVETRTATAFNLSATNALLHAPSQQFFRLRQWR